MASFEGALKTIPVLRLLVALVAGIVAVEELGMIEFSWVHVALIGCLLVVLLLVHRMATGHRVAHLAAGIIIMGTMFYTGATLTALHKTRYKPLAQGTTARVVARVVDSPQAKKNSYKTTLEIIRICDSSWHERRSMVIAYLPKDSVSGCLEINDIIMVDARVFAVNDFPTGGHFSYVNYLSHKHIFNIVRVNKGSVTCLAKGRSFSLKKTAYDFSNRVGSIYDSAHMAPAESSVLKALMLGTRTEMLPDVVASYSVTGAMHILAVSGLHVGILYLIICWVLFFMNGGWYGLARTALTLVIIWFYAFMTGFSPSVERAAIMFSLIAVARQFSFSTSIYNTLAATAFIILVFSPLDVYDIGFQLSFLAITGIVCVGSYFKEWYEPAHPVARYIYELLYVSVAAQVFTMPLSMYYFGQMPTYFLITNLVAIPVSFVVMVLGIAIVPFYYVSTAFFDGVARVLEFFVWLQNQSIITIAHMPLSSVAVTVSFAMVICLMLVLVALVIFMEVRKLQ